MRVIYCVENKQGGVSSLCYNLAANAPRVDYEQWIIHIDLVEEVMTPADLLYPLAENIHFTHSLKDNLYHSIKALRSLIPDEEGALIVNYEFEMQMLDHYSVKQTVFQLVHDDYNLGLATKYPHLVDVFIAHNKHIYQQLQTKLPGRKQHIFYLPHGVRVPVKYRQQTNASLDEPLRLLFLGRMNERKGIFDLPKIDALLKERNIPVRWTCIGNGPEKEKLIRQWSGGHIEFLSPATNDEVLNIAAEQDIFVLPTKFEGSPVSLLEAMSTGLVPVITALEGGIREIVTSEIGFAVAMDDNKAFADAIATLYYDRESLKSMSERSRKKIEQSFAVSDTAASYHELFANYKKYYQVKKPGRAKIGARLDQPWLPTFLTRVLRRKA